MIPRKMYRIVLLFLCIFLESGFSQIMSPYEKRPRLFIYDGQMIFQAGEGKSIQFKVERDSTIKFGDLDINSLPSLGQVQVYRQQLQMLGASINATSRMVPAMLTSLTVMDRELTSLKSQFNLLRTVATTPAPAENRIRRQLRRLQEDFDNLKRLVTTDECASNPCQNAGTCIDAVGKYYCLCLKQFTGPNCADDVNECTMLANTELGCQNGATCVNSHGGFTCICAPNYYGQLCTSQKQTCDAGSNAMCGAHGTCVNQGTSYKCICETGWKSDGNAAPRCVDIDECAEFNPCYPNVACINLPGRFRCGACPPGYTGNGVQCADIDECARNNGGCSLTPRVQCHNSMGSSYCGPCPPGYLGDGRTCRTGTTQCSSNPCYQGAQCFEMQESETGYRCQCPSGMVGTGVGPGGCATSTFNPCYSNPCFNGGTCVAVSSTSFTCACRPGYSSTRCELASPCASSPCQNGGTCVSNRYDETEYVCRCPTGRYGNRCQLLDDDCGGHMQLTSGSIMYPNTGPAGNNRRCAWTITTLQGSVLNITFPRFDIERSSYTAPCNYDNVTIYDGGDTGAYLIGVYCGSAFSPDRDRSVLPDPYIITSGTQLHVAFASDASVPSHGFTMNWTSVAPSAGCGARITTLSGALTSPGFPALYAPGQHCRWTFSNNPGFHYVVTVETVSLVEQSDNCTGDALEIRDGRAPDSPTLFSVCNSTTFTSQKVIASSMQYLFIYFRTVTPLQPVTGNMFGFRLRYAVQGQTRACGSTLTDEKGVITSPNYEQGRYFPGLDCVWIIDGSARSAGRVKLTFVDFDVNGQTGGSYRPSPYGGRSYGVRFERSIPMTRSSLRRPPYIAYRPPPYYNYCRGDYVEVRDGGQEYSARLGMFCGQQVPDAVSSTSSKMWIKFHSDSSDSGRGFSAMYAVQCGGTFTTRNGTFQTPSFPQASLTAVECEYEIRAPTSHSIQINFTTVDFGNSIYTYNVNNCTDYVEMKSLPSSATHNSRRYCRIPANTMFYGSGGSFKIKFVSTGSSKNKGFQVSYATYEVGCGGVVYGERGTIRSPSQNNGVPHHMYCRWTIEVQMGKVVRLTFTSTNFEVHRSCLYDYVAVYESYESDNQTDGELLKHCDSVPPPPVMSTTNSMVVLLVTDFSVQSGGFVASYEAVDVRTDCDRSFTADSGTINSFQYPLLVSRSMQCVYRIHVSRGFRILLTFDNYTLPCEFSYVEIKNGFSEASPPISGLTQSRVCGQSPVPSIRSQSNSLYLKWTVNADYRRFPGARFTLNYTQIAESCGGAIEGISATIAAPQYPLRSSQQYDCTYYINVAAGNRITFYLTSYETSNIPGYPSQQSDVTCRPFGNRLELRDGPNAGDMLLKRFCTNDDHTDFVTTSSANHMTIRYVQYTSNAGAHGFYGRFTTMCSGIILEKMYGRVASPGFRSPVSTRRDCQWTIRVPAGNQIVVQMIYFQIGSMNRSATACGRSYLEFNDNDVWNYTTQSPLVGNRTTRFCDSIAKPSQIYSKSNQLTIKFVSDASEPDNHFELEYSLGPTSCGGTFTANNTIIIVDRDAGIATEDYHLCKYTFIGPPGTQIRVNFTRKLLDCDNPPNDCANQSAILACKSAITMNNGYEMYGFGNTPQFCYQRTDKGYNVPVFEANVATIDLHYLRSKLNTGVGSVDDPLINAVAWFHFTILGTGTCGGVRTDLSGSITAPTDMTKIKTCEWLIQLPVGFRVKFQVTNIALSTSVDRISCRAQSISGGRFRQSPYLAVYDGLNDTSSEMARYCNGDPRPMPEALSSTNQLFVRFYSPGTDSKGNVSATYRAVCGARLSARALPAILKSPATRDIEDCDWTIVADRPGDKVRLSFSFVKMDILLANATVDCRRNYLAVYDGEDAENGTLLDKVCGDAAPSAFVSSGSALHLRMERTPSLFDRHFSAMYSSASSYCGGEFFGYRGRFTSPGYPVGYPSNADCVYTITAGAGNRVKIIVVSMRVQDSDGCGNDYLEIRENNRSGRSIARLCGTTIPPTPYEIKQTAWLRFHSDEALGLPGFEVSYELVFGDTLRGDTGIIESPFYEHQDAWSRLVLNVKTGPNRTVDAMRSFTLDVIDWKIEADRDKVIVLEFLDMFLMPLIPEMGSAGCQFGSELFVYDGFCPVHSSSDSGGRCPILKRACGVELPSAVQSTANTMSIHMVYGSTTAPRFKLRWRATTFRATMRPYPTRPQPNSYCGNTSLTATVGVQNLTSPYYPSNYPASSHCEWSINHPRNRSVVITIKDMDMESPSRGSCYDYLEFTQRTSPSYSYQSSPRIYYSMEARRMPNRFCTLSTSNAVNTFRYQAPVAVTFHTDASVQHKGFLLEYALACGSEFRLNPGDSQLITSPNYPDAYPSLMDCVWVIRTAPRRLLRFTVNAFELEDSPNCAKDYVRIINGPDSTSPVFQKLCSSSIGSFLSTTNVMRVEFHSDAAGVKKGFSATMDIHTVGCGDDQLELNYDQRDGILTSPNYPNPYNDSADCTWRIRSPPGTRIRLDIQNITLEQQRNTGGCYDYLEIRDGASSLSPMLRGKVCQPVPSIFSTGNYLTIRFVSDDSTNHMGFVLFYKIATCGGTIMVDGEDYITSPNYPNQYVAQTVCDWVIIAPEGHALTFSFVEVSLGALPNRNCEKDYVEIRLDGYGAGATQTNATLVGRYCSQYSETMEPKRVPSNRIYVKFFTSETSAARGFKLVFNSSVDVCGGTLTDPSGVIMSPNYPNLYHDGRVCTWYIRAQSEYSILLTFDDFHIPEGLGDRCQYDGVTFFDGPDIRSPVIRNLCGPTLRANETITSSGNEMTVRFYSDESISGRGFKATYESSVNTICGGRVTAPGTISFSKPSNRSTVYCRWRMEAPATSVHSTIEIIFNTTVMGPRGMLSDCNKEKIIIYGDSSVLGLDDERYTFCANETKSSVIFWQRTVHIIYVSSGVTAIEQLLFDFKLHACGGAREDGTGVITTPNYPNKYPDHAHCKWLLVAPSGIFNITISDIDVEEAPQGAEPCGFDYLAVYGSASVGKPMRRICGKTPKSFNVGSRLVLLEFASDHSVTHKGFTLTYSRITDDAGCGYIQNGLAGKIQSPNYPRDYSNNQYCQWELAAPVGFHINITFKTFALQPSTNCTQDYLLIEKLVKTAIRDNYRSPITIDLWKPAGDPLCSSDKPSLEEIQTDHVRLTFKSDTSGTANGFDIEWRAVCGAKYDGPSGLIRSPYYPGRYTDNLDCDYLISSPPNTISYIVLQFIDFDLEPGRGCYDYVQVFGEGAGMLSGTRLCGSILPSPLSTKGNMRVKFHSDHSSTHRGFAATYTISKCGGYINLTTDENGRTATVAAPTLSARYHSRMDCGWSITAPPGFVISFEFRNLSLEIDSTGTCRYDKVEIFEGNRTSLIGRYCGKTMPTLALKTTSNQMYIRFTTDHSNEEFGGFSGIATATLGPSQGCGNTAAVLLTDKITLRPPLESSSYHHFLKCEWKYAAAPNKVLKVKVSSFALEPRSHDGRCYDYLQFYEGDLTGQSTMGPYCGVLPAWEFSASSNSLTVIFTTDFSVAAGGFTAEIEPINRPCGGLFTATSDSQAISFTSTPALRNVRCAWTVSTNSSMDYIALSSTSFAYVDTSSTCENIRLEIKDLTTALVPATQLAYECGSSNFVYISETPAVLITSITPPDGVVTVSFNINYQKISSCNRTYELRQSDVGGRITSPNYPDRYPHGSDCQTNFIAPVGSRVTIAFKFFQLERSGYRVCEYDFVQFTESRTFSESSQGVISPVNSSKYCGYTLPPTYTSSSNRVTLNFKSDRTDNEKGWDATFTFTDSDCGGPVTAKEGVITSPGYPNGNLTAFPPNLQCDWVIRTGRKGGIALTLASLFMSPYMMPTETCDDNSDSLSVYVGDSATGMPVIRWCSGSQSPREKTLGNANTVLVRFTARSRDDVGTRFRLLFKAIPIFEATTAAPTPDYPDMPPFPFPSPPPYDEFDNDYVLRPVRQPIRLG